MPKEPLPPSVDVKLASAIFDEDDSDEVDSLEEYFEPEEEKVRTLNVGKTYERKRKMVVAVASEEKEEARKLLQHCQGG